MDPSIQHDPDQIEEEKAMDPTAKKYFALTQNQDLLKKSNPQKKMFGQNQKVEQGPNQVLK